MSMTISAEMFQDILSSLNGDGRNGRIADRRKGARVGVRAILSIERLVVGDTGFLEANAHLREISRGGIGLISPVRMSKGEVFRVSFPSNQGNPIQVEYVVRHVQPLKPSLFRIGAQLQNLLQSETGETTIEKRCA
ncbi:MAG: hypothetical protein KatS3mg104_0965 [Phycisphaerae bacterium]|nr:MAG: hypothetical protein KatS3mg104_0965 [Phycisphaerae bacterium]